MSIAPGGARHGWAARSVLAVAGIMLVVPMVGCANLGYYRQAVAGHLDVLHRARPVADWLANPDTSLALRERLALTQRIRDFAVQQLHLPDNASYRRYADLGRTAVVWNVVAAPRHGLTLKTWCFAVVGCVGYRGYFREAHAQALADELRAQGWEVLVYPVPAYSTLGRLNWLGGDPLLSSFIHYPEGELARLIFHELAHQVVFVPGDTVFNESFATAVERLGGALWLAQQADEAARIEYDIFDRRRRAFRELARNTRARLEALYARPAAGPAGVADLDAEKDAVLADFRAAYWVLRQSWGGFSGYDGWVARANNAAFAIQAAYDQEVPAFEALFEREGRDWRRFYDAVRGLAALSAPERARALRGLAAPSSPPPASRSGLTEEKPLA